MKILNLVKKYRVYLLFVLIIAISIFLRFHRLGDIYVFNLDEEYQASYAWTEVLHPHRIWIGLVAAALEFYIGPYVVYLTAILLGISHGDPLITAYFAAGLGVVTTAAIFFIGKKVFNLTTAVLAASLYATMPIFVFFDQKYWNPMFGPLVTVLLFLSLIQTKQSKWWWVVFAGLAGIIFETHLPPFPLLLIGGWGFLKHRYWQDLKLLTFCIVVFLIFYWPLLVFDFNHDFSNLKVVTRLFVTNSQSKVSFNPGAKFGTLFDSMGRFWYLRPGSPNADEVNFGCSSLSLSTGFETIDKYTRRTYAPFWLSSISLILLLIFLRKNLRNADDNCRILALFLTISGFFFLIYPGGSFEYYALIFLTLFTFVPGILISQLNKKLAVGLFGIIIIFSILGINTVLHTSDEFSLGPKKKLIAEVMKIVGQEDFAIEGRGICHNYEGWRYLFKVYGRVPTQSYTDDSLGWLYPKEIGKEKPAITVILSEDRIPLKEDLSSLTSVRSGGYRAYIRKK